MDKNNNYSLNTTYLTKSFQLKHVFRAGAIVWTKFKGKDYYLVFKSYSRPTRGIQLPGGRIERNENPVNTVIREVKEETGIDTKIICPLGYVFVENEKDNYSNLQIFYLLRPIYTVNIFEKWKHIDRDKTKQELECWFVNAEESNDFLVESQINIVNIFKKWLIDHKKDYSLTNPSNIN